MLKKLLGVAIFIATCSAAMAQGQLPAGNVWGNPLASGAPAKPSTVTAILDRALGSTRGSILERGSSGWAIVGPGATAGLAWISAGTGADPAYGILGLSGGGCNAALVASNGGILYSTASACAILAGTATARLPLLSGANAAPVWGAYTLPASVTSGGVPCFVSTSAEGSSVLLTANALVLGGGAATCPSPMASLGTTTTVLHGNAAGAPTFGAVNLTTDVSNQLPFANGGCNGTTQQSCFDNAAPTPTRAGDLAYWNGSHWVTLAGNNSGTQILTENASGVPAWAANGSVSNVIIAPGAGISVSGTCTITTSGTCTVAQSLTSATLQASPANPTGTASVTSVMMGLGTTCKITPVYSGRVKLEFYGNVSTTAAGNNSFVKASFNSGTAPLNGVAFTGTLVGTEQQIFSSSASVNQEFMVGGIITGLTPGTAYWFDLGIRAPSGTSTAISISCNAMEF